jgi:hypothetical protein
LRVAVDGRQRAVDDGGDVVEVDLEEDFGAHPLDGQVNLVDADVGPGGELQEVGEARVERDARAQVFNLERDLLDREVRHVEQHIGVARGGRLAATLARLLLPALVFLRERADGRDRRRRRARRRLLARRPRARRRAADRGVGVAAVGRGRRRLRGGFRAEREGQDCSE